MENAQRPTGPGGLKPRDVGLDLLRFVAVWLVLFRHVEFPENFDRAWAEPLVWLKRGGWIGVDIFFVLSGFLVSGLLFKEYRRNQTLSVKRFLIRRGLKIYPACWFMIGVTVLYRHFVQHQEISYRGLLGEALFIQNYLAAMWVHTWSLAVEEHFYLLLATITYILVRMHRGSPDPFRFLPGFFLAVAITCFVLRWITVERLPYDVKWHAMFWTHLRIDSLLFGVLISYWVHFHSTEKQRGRLSQARFVLVLAGCLLCAPPFFIEVTKAPWMVVAGPALFFCGAGCLLLAVASSDLSKQPFAVWAARLGAYSYSVYLWHRAVQEWGHPLFLKFFNGDTQWILWTGYYLVGSWAGGILMARLIEIPVLRLRDLLFPGMLNSASANPRVGSVSERAPQSP